MDDYGTDLASPDGSLDPAGLEASGTLLLGYDLAARWESSGIWYDQAYGFDLRVFLNEPITPSTFARIQVGMTNEALKDERVKSIQVLTPQIEDLSATEKRLRIQTIVEPVTGETFTLVVGVSSVSVALLALE